MKKIVCFLLVGILVLSLCGCAAKKNIDKEKIAAVEESIESIGNKISEGYVSEDGLTALMNARLLYDELSDDEKAAVSNYDAFSEADRYACEYIIEEIKSSEKEHKAEEAVNLCDVLKSISLDEKAYQFAVDTKRSVLEDCYAGTRMYQLQNVVSPVVTSYKCAATQAVLEKDKQITTNYYFNSNSDAAIAQLEFNNYCLSSGFLMVSNSDKSWLGGSIQTITHFKDEQGNALSTWLMYADAGKGILPTVTVTIDASIINFDEIDLNAMGSEKTIADTADILICE